MIQFDEHIFQMGWKHQLVIHNLEKSRRMAHVSLVYHSPYVIVIAAIPKNYLGVERLMACWWLQRNRSTLTVWSPHLPVLLSSSAVDVSILQGNDVSYLELNFPWLSWFVQGKHIFWNQPWDESSTYIPPFCENVHRFRCYGQGFIVSAY